METDEISNIGVQGLLFDQKRHCQKLLEKRILAAF